MKDDGAYQALLLVSFGGPEGPDEILPFLEHVTRGRGVPRSRLLEVAEHYHHLGGTSPINAQSRALLAALRQELATRGPRLPVYWGNRHWHPFLAAAVREMARDGVRRALAFVTSAYGSYSSCRQYRDALDRAAAEVGPVAPIIDKLRLFWNHPGFVEPMAERVRAALAALPPDRRHGSPIAFTAHSIPLAMAATSEYQAQLLDAAELVAARLPGDHPWRLVYQSRSGSPTVPWLEPDIGEHLASLAAAGARAVVVAPIGFVSDHLEVRYDLDVEAARRAGALGLAFQRAATVGTHPSFVAMVGELARERTESAPRRALGARGPWPDGCLAGCCPAPGGPPAGPGPSPGQALPPARR